MPGTTSYSWDTCGAWSNGRRESSLLWTGILCSILLQSLPEFQGPRRTTETRVGHGARAGGESLELRFPRQSTKQGRGAVAWIDDTRMEQKDAGIAALQEHAPTRK